MGHKRRIDLEIIATEGRIEGPSYWLSQASALGLSGRVVQRPSGAARYVIWWNRSTPTVDADWSLHDTSVWDTLGWAWPSTRLTDNVGRVICDVSVISRSAAKSARLWRYIRKEIGDRDVTLVAGSREPPSSFEVFDQCVDRPDGVTHFVHAPRADVLGHAAADCHKAGIAPINVDVATVREYAARFRHVLEQIRCG